MRNRYPGNCYKCGVIVKAGEGHFEKKDGKWRVQHAWHASKVIASGSVKKVRKETIGK